MFAIHGDYQLVLHEAAWIRIAHASDHLLPPHPSIILITLNSGRAEYTDRGVEALRFRRVFFQSLRCTTKDFDLHRPHY